MAQNRPHYTAEVIREKVHHDDNQGFRMKKALTVLLLTTSFIGTASAETLHFGTTTANPPFETVKGKGQQRVSTLIWPMRCVNRCRRNANSRRSALIPSFRRCALKSSTPLSPALKCCRCVKSRSPSANLIAELSGVVVTAKDAAHGFADLQGKKLAVVKGSVHQRYLRDKQKGIQAVAFDNDSDALAALKSGEVDGAIGDLATMDQWLAENPDYAEMKERATDPAYYGKQYAIAVRKDDPELLKQINDALEAVKASPEFQQMEQKWFK